MNPKFATACLRCLLAVITVVLYISPASSSSAVAHPDTWRNIAISGSNCFVTGIVAQPLQPGLFYVRCDCGGAYRWDAKMSTWIPITDGFNFDQRQYCGIESIAVDPADKNTLYIAAGMYVDKLVRGAIFKSTDQGASWTKLIGLNGGEGLPMGANMDRRWGGERLAVNPANSKIILFGSRQNGLWRTVDGGASWSQAPSIPSPNPSKKAIYGVASVVFDPSSPSTVYAAVSADGSLTVNPGIYVSYDSGASFTLLQNSITDVRRMVIGSDGALWVTYGSGVAKYARRVWSNVTPSAPGPYVGIAINPQNPACVFVSRSEVDQTNTYSTTNGGETWSELSYVVSSATPVSWFRTRRGGSSNFAFDPHNPNVLWYVNGLGIWRTSNLASSPVVFEQSVAGHEETVPTDLVCPPAGPELVVGEMDVDGFTFTSDSLSKYPAKMLGLYDGKRRSWSGITDDIAYAEGSPANMVRAGGQENRLAGVVSLSSDSGATWYKSQSFSASGRVALRVAMSATDPTNIVVLSSGSYVYSTDGGTTWLPCQGLPPAPTRVEAERPLSADSVIDGTFYYYNHGLVYRSRDKGATWGQVSHPNDLPNLGTYQLTCQKGVAGDLWLSEENDWMTWQHVGPLPAADGLYHSTDGGATWNKLSGVTRAVSFSFGKKSPAGVSSLFVYGRLNGDIVDQMYWSVDLGQSWINISDPKYPIGNNPWCIAGSQQTYGRVFVGTGGRGVFWGDPSSHR
ncbi:MAG: hypothetical protein P4L33_09100 [Capsulimonadaceae bacterium]|nr:hypothetical protein [Capsulimonadaceae bacterium]